MATAKNQPLVVDFVETDIGQVQVGILGLTPYLHNRMAEKAKHELLLPKGRKNAAERASSLKHDPVEEFRSSPYMLVDDDAETLLADDGFDVQRSHLDRCARFTWSDQSADCGLLGSDGL